jgi:hypothetical protein
MGTPPLDSVLQQTATRPGRFRMLFSRRYGTRARASCLLPHASASIWLLWRLMNACAAAGARNVAGMLGAVLTGPGLGFGVRGAFLGYTAVRWMYGKAEQ